MKFPNSILLDFENNENSYREYWLIKYLIQNENSYYLNENFFFSDTNVFQKKNLTQKKFTTKHIFYYKRRNVFFKIKNKEETPQILFFNFDISKKIALLLYKNKNSYVFNKNKLKNIISRLEKFNLTICQKKFVNLLSFRFNIIFFKKEKIYTKLKYSRVPQYDAVSGGSAAILAGFLSYLITEKFGIELVDSGDFWFFFMYTAFAVFSIKPLLNMIKDDLIDISPLSWRWGWNFYKAIVMLFCKFLTQKFKK